MKDINIQEYIDIDYATDERVNRRKGSGGTQEFYTPYSIVKKMCDKVPEEEWADPTKTFLEPCCGNGNFVLYIIYNRLKHGIDWKDALNTLYALELMEDNVQECKERIINLLNDLDIAYNPIEAYEIMDRNIICHDFFTWDFEHWCEVGEKKSDDKKVINKKVKKNIKEEFPETFFGIEW